VDFEELMSRQKSYSRDEKCQLAGAK